jgi:uncharacterized protein YndB with AHSA1/START domain
MINLSDTLTVTLPSDTTILIERSFAAPRHLVWRAWTEPDLIRQWWAGDRGQVTSIEVDLRVGGTWRYVMTANEGFEVAFHGDYREIVPDERLVSTEVYEAVPDHPAVDTMTLSEADGRTMLRILVEHDSTISRDMHVNSGMENGLREALDHAEQVVTSLAG